MKFNKITAFALLISTILLLTSCNHTHSFGKWKDYGSYQARECKECGYVEREYFGDEYKQDDTISKTDDTSSGTGKESETAVSPQDLIKVCTRIDVTYVDPSVPRVGVVPTYYLYKYDNEGNQINETAYTYYDEIANFTMYRFDDNSTGRFTNVRKCVEDGLNVEYRDELDPNDSLGRYDRWRIVYNPDGTPNSEMLVPAYSSLSLSPGGKYEYFYDDEGLLIRLVQYSVSMDYNLDDPNDNLSYPKFTKRCTYEYTYQTLSQYLAQKGTNSNSGIPNGNGKTGNNSGSGVTPKTCPACFGKKSKECNGCDGKGKTLSYYDINHNPVYSTCSICHGSGSVSCKVCGGDGMIYD